MKKFFIYFSIIFLVVIFQTSSIAFLFDLNWMVDVVLMLVLAWTLLDGFEEFFPWVIFIGVLCDLAHFTPIGLHVLILSLLAYGVSFFSKRFSVEIKGTGILVVMFFVAAATLGSRIILLFWEVDSSALLVDLSNFWITLRMFSLTFFYNLLIFFFLFFILGKVEKFFHLRKGDKTISI